MAEIIAMGEAIVEIMRPEPDMRLKDPGLFKGPYPSGAPAIFIDAAARLGHTAALISGVGEDDFGDLLVGRLSEDGVDTSMILRDERTSTGCAFVTYFSNGERKFIFHIGNTPAVKAPVPPPSALSGCRFFHVMGCSVTSDAGFGERIAETARLVRKAGGKVSFDPNVRPELMKDPSSRKALEEILRMSAVFLPGKSELSLLTGTEGIPEGVRAAFIRYPELERVIVKDGSRGSHAFCRDGRCESFGIYPVEPVDPTGAGDTFDAAFLCGLLDGRSVADCLRRASAAAALNTAAFGPMEGRVTEEKVEETILRGERQA